MPRPRLGAVHVQVTADTTLVTTAETVALTIPNINTQSADDKISISGVVAVNPGTATNQVQVVIRRGTDATGTTIGEVVFDLASVSWGNTLPFSADDIPGEVAGQSYVVTVKCVSATANGVVTYAAAQVLIGT